MILFLYLVLLIWSACATLYLISCLENPGEWPGLAKAWIGPLMISFGLNLWAGMSASDYGTCNLLSLAILFPPLAFCTGQLFQEYVIQPLEDRQLRKMEEEITGGPLRTFTSTTPKGAHLPTMSGDIDQVVKALKANLEQLEDQNERDPKSK